MQAPSAAVGYLTAAGALLLEFTGYNRDAVYWLISWGRTTAVLLWGALIFLVILWIVGILIALHVFGLNTTSLAVTRNPQHAPS